MISAILRKSRQFVNDPILRGWAIGAVLGQYARPKPATRHVPHYLSGSLPIVLERATRQLPTARHLTGIDGVLMIDLPGKTVILDPARPDALYARDFADTETLLAVHRFAWLPLQEETPAHAWLDLLWRTWLERYPSPDDSWVWHPYTAAERAINILDYASRHGLPGPVDQTTAALERHVGAITARLEYFGDHDTSNHLSNNGRGIYRIGLALGIEPAIDIGRRILLEEAKRIFGRSGILREGSSHYHLLLTRNYIDVWRHARAHRRTEAEDFASIVRRGLAALAHLTLPGGLPLIGDISPDCPPTFLAGLLPGGDLTKGWCALLDRRSRNELAELRESAECCVSPEVDGWFRAESEHWTMLLHVAPQGWAPMPGHGHQDIGSFEAHWDNTPLIVDPGRGAYGDSGEAAFFTSAAAHSGITIDSIDPFPPNKPYYDDFFRSKVCGPPPKVHREPRRMTIVHHGFSRMADLGRTERTFYVSDDNISIEDKLEGKGSHRVCRRVWTPWPAVVDHGVALIDTPVGRFCVSGDGQLSLKAAKRWLAYGCSVPANVIEFETIDDLPSRFTLVIQKASTS